MRYFALLFFTSVLWSLTVNSQDLQMKEGLFARYASYEGGGCVYRGSEVLFFLDSDTTSSTLEFWIQNIDSLKFLRNDSLYEEKIFFGILTSGVANSDDLSSGKDSIQYQQKLASLGLSTYLIDLEERFRDSYHSISYKKQCDSNPVFSGKGDSLQVEVSLVYLSVLVYEYQVDSNSTLNMNEFHGFLWDDVNQVYRSTLKPGFGKVNVLVGVR